MGNTLYLECSAGISGDMAVAALLDLGANEKVLMEVLDSIPAGGFFVEIGRVKKAGIDCCDFHVILDAEHENHDHDMEYLHGHVHEEHHHSHDHVHGEHHHSHGHVHGEHHHSHDHVHEEHHHHEHRGMAEVTKIIQETKMTERARKIALDIFEIIAKAEAKAHAVPAEQVHFHEVGAIDSIVDVVAAAVCLDNLDVDEVIVPRLCEGRGTVRCQHGVLPVPVPAVANIAEVYGLHLEIIDIQGEFVTPTGAAIVAAVKTSDKLPDCFQIKKSGIGAGKRTYERPSILRAMLIEAQAEQKVGNKDFIYCLETNIDDCTGEVLGYVLELLFAAGARDVYYYPVFMKKNRPAWQLNVICDAKDISSLEEIIFRETTTIGIRRVQMERTVLPRENQQVDTPWGTAQVKRCLLGNQIKYYPEYESVKELSRQKAISYREMYDKILSCCQSQSNESMTE